MRRYRIFFPIITLVLLFSGTTMKSTSAFWSSEQKFTADDNSLYEFAVRAETPLSWSEQDFNPITINFTVTKTPDNASGIKILYLVFTLRGEVNGVETTVGERSEGVNKEFREIGKVEQFSSQMNAPELVNQFTLNITIAAVVTGNDTSQNAANPRLYFYLFSEILNKKSQQVQVFVDLYGFPPGSFINQWLMVVIPIGLLVLLPAIYMLGTMTVRSMRKKRGVKQENLEEGGKEK